MDLCQAPNAIPVLAFSQPKGFFHFSFICYIQPLRMLLSHPREDKGFAGAIINCPSDPYGSLRSRFLLKERGCCSSSWLMVLSLSRGKDGTRTIEMILVSTVLKSIEAEWTPYITLQGPTSGKTFVAHAH